MAEKRYPLRVWIAAAFVVAVVSLVIDQNTGDTTGPPYHDSLLNQSAFFVFFAATILFLGLSVFAFARLVRGRLAHRA
jgi:hypothetical protein